MDTTPDPVTPASTDELTDLFEQLVGGSSGIADLEQAQREVWVSGLLASWRSDVVVADPDAADQAFLAYCQGSSDPAAAIIATVATEVLAGTTSSAPQSAWRITRNGADDTHSVIIAFAESSGAAHCLLADIDDGSLVDLTFAGEPAEVVPDPAEVRADMDQVLTIEELAADQAGAEVAAAWDAAIQAGVADPASGLVMNQLAARARLLGCQPPTGPTPVMAMFVAAPTEALSFTEGMSDAEVADANSWALGVLTTALRKLQLPAAPAQDVIDATRSPLRGPIAHLDRREQQALCFLEWADWLGVLIGLVRAGPGASVDPASMVDLINRCDEVSSTVPQEDRDYIEYAFEVAIAMWSDAGVVEDGRLTSDGHAALVPAATDAWS